MRHQRLLLVLAGTLAAAVSPLAVRPAQGQSASGYYYETYRYGYNPGYYARRYAALPVFTVPSKMSPSSLPYVHYVPPGISSPKSNRALAYEARVLSGAVTPAPADASVQIDLQVPADAQVWFDGEKTTQIGALRRFVSPPLAPGREYSYEVRAAWKEGGREVTESRRLSLRAGDHVRASFPAVAARLAANTDVRPAR